MLRKINRRPIRKNRNRVNHMRYSERMRGKCQPPSDEIRGIGIPGAGFGNDIDETPVADVSVEIEETEKDKPEVPGIYTRPIENPTPCEFLKREAVNDADILWDYDVYTYESYFGRGQSEIYAKEFAGANEILEFLNRVRRTPASRAATRFGESYYTMAKNSDVSEFMQAVAGKREFEELAEIKKIVDSIEATGVMDGSRTRNKLTRKDQGDELDIHAMRMGNLDRCWTAKKKVRTKGKGQKQYIHLTIDITTQKGNPAKWFAACAYLYARAAERAGKKVKISCLSLWRSRGYERASQTTSRRGNPVDNLTIDTVKDYGERTNLNTLAALTSHEFDVSIDAIIDANGSYRKQKGWTPGGSGAFLSAAKHIVSRKNRTEDLVFCEIEANLESAVAWLSERCRKLRML